MQDRPTERVRALLEGLTAHAIVERVHPYYHGFQFEGEWLDDWRDAVMAECDRLDERCGEVRDGQVRASVAG